MRNRNLTIAILQQLEQDAETKRFVLKQRKAQAQKLKKVYAQSHDILKDCGIMRAL